MADRYINSAFITAQLGAGFVAAVVALGVDLNAHIETATSTVQKKAQNAGYATPSTQDPTEVEQAVKDAVFMATWISLTSIPECSIKLPENYKEHPAYQAYAGIMTGQIPLAASPSQIGAVGGMQFTNGTPGVSGAAVQRTSRTNLGGY